MPDDVQVNSIFRCQRNLLSQSSLDLSESTSNHWLRQLFAVCGCVFHDQSIRASLFAFVLTRSSILFVALLAANVRFEAPVITPLGEVRGSTISLRNRRVSDVLREITLGADSLWLIDVARRGYENEPFNTDTQHNWAFFPLFPLLLRAAARVTGEFPLTGMALSNCFLFLALVLLHKAAGAFGYDLAASDRAVFYMAAFPASYFFSLAQTESLFLLLTVGCLYAARRERWWLAGCGGALASATRFAGVFLLLPLGLLYWQTYRAAAAGGTSPDSKRSERISKRFAGTVIDGNLVALLLVPLGLIAFMIFLKAITGNALAFADIQVAWGHSAGFFWRPLLTYLRDPFVVATGWDFRLLNFAAAMTALICGSVLLWRHEWALGSYALISIVVPMSSGPLLQSLARYTMVIFPVCFVLAAAGRSPRVDQFIRLIFIGLLCLMSALLASRVTLTFA